MSNKQSFSMTLQQYYNELEENSKKLKINETPELHDERCFILQKIKHHIRYGRR